MDLIMSVHTLCPLVPRHLSYWVLLPPRGTPAERLRVLVSPFHLLQNLGRVLHHNFDRACKGNHMTMNALACMCWGQASCLSVTSKPIFYHYDLIMYMCSHWHTFVCCSKVGHTLEQHTNIVRGARLPWAFLRRSTALACSASSKFCKENEQAESCAC